MKKETQYNKFKKTTTYFAEYPIERDILAGYPANSVFSETLKTKIQYDTCIIGNDIGDDRRWLLLRQPLHQTAETARRYQPGSVLRRAPSSQLSVISP